jgi:hypothetical protein
MNKGQRCHYLECVALIRHPIDCSFCRLVQYCSERCRLNDSIVHSEVCHTELSERLKGMVSLIVRYTPSSERKSLSYCGGSIHVNSFRHRLSAFGLSGRESVCAICSGLIRWTIPAETSFQHMTHTILYSPCGSCDVTGKLLCTSSFKERSLCCFLHCRKRILILALTPLLISDVLSLIASLFLSLCPCIRDCV